MDLAAGHALAYFQHQPSPVDRLYLAGAELCELDSGLGGKFVSGGRLVCAIAVGHHPRADPSQSSEEALRALRWLAREDPRQLDAGALDGERLGRALQHRFVSLVSHARRSPSSSASIGGVSIRGQRGVAFQLGAMHLVHVGREGQCMPMGVDHSIGAELARATSPGTAARLREPAHVLYAGDYQYVAPMHVQRFQLREGERVVILSQPARDAVDLATIGGLLSTGTVAEGAERLRRTLRELAPGSASVVVVASGSTGT